MMGCALISGISYTEALDMPIGLIIDLFLQRMRYDDALHGIKRGE